MSTIRVSVSVACLGIAVLVGCDAPVAHFSLNLPYMHKQEQVNGVQFTAAQMQDVTDILTAMFGTPDEPFIAEGTGTGIEDLVRLENLKIAAGPVRTEESGPAGLYRQHCGHCHGTTGDGKGPTAEFLNPYPRDYRRGSYKFKSTPIGVRPTRDDLKRVLLQGVAGTAMPSFKLLSDPELEALVDYVIYLSIRGEVERRLWDEFLPDLDEGERLVTEDGMEDLVAIMNEELLTEAVERWAEAGEQITPVPKRPDWDEVETLVSIQRGKELFYGAVANCVKCHGESQLGDGQTTDYDEWTKEFYDWTRDSQAEDYQQALQEYLALDGLPPRTIMPRNLAPRSVSRWPAASRRVLADSQWH